MDLKGSLIDTNVRIYPSQKLKDFIKTIAVNRKTPYNIAKIAKSEDFVAQTKSDITLKPIDYELNKADIAKINKIRNIVKSKEPTFTEESETEPNKKIDDKNINKNKDDDNKEKYSEKSASTKSKENSKDEESETEPNKKIDDKNVNENKNDDNKEKYSEKSVYEKNKENSKDEQYLVTTDIDWLYLYLKEKRSKGDRDVPFLHILLEGVDVVMPDNKIIKRNPMLEERCVKLRAQQEARDYRKMTKSVDNVRMRFPEDSISYQLKQLNRQLIAIGQFILSILAGFLFGFQGVEWLIGPFDFGFRLILGVMCALIIALAEIYFLAKKLNEELNVPETVQIGGPTKFAEEPTCHGHKIGKYEKEHID